mgnify:CR=1 FL=1
MCWMSPILVTPSAPGEVTGSSRYQAGEVAAASGVELGDNLVLLDKYHIAQRIYTELPYVTEARINRKFPSTLERSL